MGDLEPKLQDLIEEWREHDRLEHAMFNEGQFQAADELEQVLRDYE